MLHLSNCNIFLSLKMYIPPRFHLQTYFNIQNNANGLWGLLGYFGQVVQACEKHTDEFRGTTHDSEDNDRVVIAQMKTTAVLSGNTFL